VLGAVRVGATPEAAGEALRLGAEGADAAGRAVARRTWARFRRAAAPAARVSGERAASKARTR